MRKLFLSLILSLFVFLAYAEGISNYKELLTFAKAVNKGADISMWQNEKGHVCLDADPALVNKDPYGEGWMVKIKMSAPEEVESLLSADDYADFIAK